MIRNLLSAIILMLPLGVLAQTGDTLSLDLLRAPSSPAFNLLGVAPSLIERPTDLNAFRVSIQNASNSFTQLPSEYSVEVAPANFTRLDNLTLDKYNSTQFRDVFWQSFSLSAGLAQGDLKDRVTDDSGTFSKLGLGIRFSILRPAWNAATLSAYNKLHDALAAAMHPTEELILHDPTLDSLSHAYRTYAREHHGEPGLEAALSAITQQKNARINVLRTQHLNDSLYFLAVRNTAKAFRIDRYGPFLDFAGGIALDFPDSRFNYSQMSRAGAWLTGGFENSGGGFSAMAIIRYLYHPEEQFTNDQGRLDRANISTLDGGIRILLTAAGGKLSLSAEGIYRSILNAGLLQPNWRYTINTDYDIGLNKKLTFALGKNFDGTLSKSGNIIAALNFIAGFGASGKIH